MASKTENKCGHQLCDCGVRPGSEYCSEVCQQQDKAEPGDAIACPCGHQDCGAGGTGEKEEF